MLILAILGVCGMIGSMEATFSRSRDHEGREPCKS